WLETSVNQLAIAAAVKTLGDGEHLERERRLTRESRDYTVRLFESIGYKVRPSEGNFLFINLGQDARVFRDGCRQAGVRGGRGFPPWPSYVRISMGTIEEMQRAGDVSGRVLRGQKPPASA